MDKLLIEGEGLNKYKALKERKIKAAKEYAESKGVLKQLPKEKKFWENLVGLVDHLCRVTTNANEVPSYEHVSFERAFKDYTEKSNLNEASPSSLEE